MVRRVNRKALQCRDSSLKDNQAVNKRYQEKRVNGGPLVELPSPRVPKILIISSDTGGGHRSAAAAIVAGVQNFLEGESYAIRVVRAVEESHHLADKLVRLYNWIRSEEHTSELQS